MKRILYILVLLAITTPLYSQWQAKILPGPRTLKLWNRDTIYIGQDTIATNQTSIRIIDSMATANGYTGGGGRTYIKDIQNLSGTIDSSGALYTLHYSIDNTWYSQGGTTSFSNQATDSTTIAVGTVGGSGLLVPGEIAVLERFVIFTNSSEELRATFDAHPPVSNDSLLLSFHIVNRGGFTYLTVWKHKLTIGTLSIGVTTAGTMILEQLLGTAFGTLGNTVQFRFALFVNRRRR